MHEPWDTKLARRPGPAAIVQLSAYAEALGKIGEGSPEYMYLLTGDRGIHAHRVADFTPVLDAVRERLLARLRGPAHLPDPLWDEPRPSCEGCGYAAMCAEGRAGARHLSLVAGIRTDQVRKLADSGIATIDALALAGEEDRPESLPRHSYERLRAQATLQTRQDATRTAEDPLGTVIAEVYSEEGLAMLPEPSPGDVFFDMEGFPYFGGADGRGLEYLFGAVTEDPQEGREFHTFWAHDSAQEKRAFEEFVDFVARRIDTDPGAHVYHYASYEVDRLKLLAATFGTRETDVDELLRHRRLVDLFTAVKKSLRVSQRSYSIKYLEPLYLDGARSGDVTTATSSIDAYADYIAAVQAGEDGRACQILEGIASYNRDDCVSTARLRDWLEELRTRHGITARPAGQGELTAGDAEERAAERLRRRAEYEERLRTLTEPLLHGPQAPEDHYEARALLAALAGYYRREENPAWWEYFRRISAPAEELEADGDCMVPLRVHRGEWQEPAGRQRKARRELEMRADPARPHPFTTGDEVRLLYPGPPGQQAATVNARIEAVSAERLTLVETSDPGDTYARNPAAVLPGAPVRSAPKDEALLRLTEEVVDGLPELPARAGMDILRRVPPRTRDGAALPRPDDHGSDPVACVIEAVDRLDDSYLAVQGPPGAGKTYLAARLITHLAGQGRSVGVCSTGHTAIENVLSAAVRAAGGAGGTALPCAKRPRRKPAPEAPWDQPTSPKGLAAWRSEQQGGYLVGGTAWNFANEAIIADPFDVLIIDEAGQFALADTLAVSVATRNLVLLGDPQQLPQVVQGSHAAGAAASALEHLVGDSEIIAPELGYFLDQSRRMHPAVCAPVSRLAYRGRLRAHPSTAERAIQQVEPGLRRITVEHRGRNTHSPEEVARVVDVAGRLVGRTLHDGEAGARPLTGADILVVAPFNLQVRALRSALHEAGLSEVSVGTVDRFQGQEAPVVLCSMTASSASDLPRGLDFVLSRNRLNVALSRAQVLAVLVYSPHLLASSPRSVTELRALAGFTGLCARTSPWLGSAGHEHNEVFATAHSTS